MDYKRGSSAVAKTGLGLGIAGTALGLLGGTNLLNGAAPVEAAALRAAPYGGGWGAPWGGYGPGCGWEGRGRYGCHFEDEAETHYEARLHQEVTNKDFEISILKGEKYTDCRVAALEKQICDLRVGLAMEVKDRECCCKELAHADQDIINYANCTFIPQEKGFMDGRRVNFHGVRPELILDPRFTDDRRDRRDRDDCREGFRDGCGCGER